MDKLPLASTHLLIGPANKGGAASNRQIDSKVFMIFWPGLFCLVRRQDSDANQWQNFKV
jgi:hypothetical protein